MTDLARVPLAQILPAARQFRNLRFHRIYVLEGLARTAHRNIRHMIDAGERIGPRIPCRTSGRLNEWSAEIQTEMLRDHALSHSGVSLQLPSFSTTLPIMLYCAVLNAEVEFLRQLPRPLRYLVDEETVRRLDQYSELIDRLRGFRNGFLKPQVSTVTAEDNLFNDSLFNDVPSLLSTVDLIMARMRHGLKIEVESLLLNLPGEQAALCRFLHIQECGRNILIRENDSVLEALGEALSGVLKDASRFATEVRGLKFSGQELKNASLVVELLNSVSEYEEMALLGDVPEYDTFQPPFETEFLLSLMKLQSEGTHDLKLYGRTAAHIADYIDHYMRVLYISYVCANETYELIRKAAGDRPFQTIHDMESASRNVPAREAARITSLNLVQASMLTRILELYQKVRSENPHAIVPILDQIIDDQEGFSALITVRNSVFHVEKNKMRAEQRDNDTLRKIISTEFLSDLSAGVEQFLIGIKLGSVTRFQERWQ